MKYDIESIAFESKEPDRGYTVKASYLTAQHKGDALVEIFKDGQKLREFLFPAYKIWNIAAHFQDIVDGEVESSFHGYQMAAWDGISGAVVIDPSQPRSGQDFISAQERRFAIEIAPDHYERDNDAIEEERAANIRDRQINEDDANGEQP